MFSGIKNCKFYQISILKMRDRLRFAGSSVINIFQMLTVPWWHISFASEVSKHIVVELWTESLLVSFWLSGEKSIANGRQFSLKDLHQTVFERVRANDTSIVRVNNDATALTSVLLCEILVPHHSQCARIITRCLSKHNFSVLLLAFIKHGEYHGNFIFAHHKLQCLLHHFNHTLSRTIVHFSLLRLRWYLGNLIFSCLKLAI